MPETEPKLGLPIVGGEPYSEADDWEDSILRGLQRGFESRDAAERARLAADQGRPKT